MAEHQTAASIDLEADAISSQRVPDAKDQAEVQKMTLEYLELAKRAIPLEQELKQIRESMTELEYKTIPTYMEDFSIKAFKFTDGTELSIEEGLNAYIPSTDEEKQAKCFDYLESIGKGDIIKTRTIRNVHPGTLKKFIKDCREEGISIDEELFGVYNYKRAKIKLPK